jgi:hypothetical protein
MKPITKWYRQSKGVDNETAFEFNHIENGHCQNAFPTPKHESHKKAWSGKWTKTFAYLTDTIPPIVVDFYPL